MLHRQQIRHFRQPVTNIVDAGLAEQRIEKSLHVEGNGSLPFAGSQTRMTFRSFIGYDFPKMSFLLLTLLFLIPFN